MTDNGSWDLFPDFPDVGCMSFTCGIGLGGQTRALQDQGQLTSMAGQ